MRPLTVLLLATAACDDGGNTTDDGNGNTHVDETVTVDIVAAVGGTVEVAEATLAIPPGALSADTTITAMTVEAAGLPDNTTVVGEGYDFGPDGLTFLAPATLTIDGGTAPASGKTYVVSWLDDTGGWVDLATTTTGTSASAPVDHFTVFAMRSVDLPPDVDVCEFSACQGDVVGDWHLLGQCWPAGIPNPWIGICPTSVFEPVFDSTGTYNVQAGGTYDYAVTTTIMFTVTFPAACNVEFPMCSIWNNVTQGTCTGDPTVECVCEGSFPSEPTQGNGTWGYEADQVWFDDGQGEGPDYHEYCREGSILKVRTVDEGIITTVGL